MVRQTERVWATPWNMADGILRMPCGDDREDRKETVDEVKMREEEAKTM